jgi:hypothetical protein
MIPPIGCPRFRDNREDRHYYSRVGQELGDLADGNGSCGQPEWDAAFNRAEKRYREANACNRVLQPESFDEDELVRVKINQTYFQKCLRYRDRDVITGALRSFPEESFTFDARVPIAFSAWIGEWEARDIAHVFRVANRAAERMCPGTSLSACLTKVISDAAASNPRDEVGDKAGLAAAEMLREEFGLDARRLGPTFGSAMASVGAVNNFVLNVIVCNGLADDRVAKEAGMDRQAFCKARGLYANMLVADVGREDIIRDHSIRDDNPQSFDAIFVRRNRRTRPPWLP